MSTSNVGSVNGNSAPAGTTGAGTAANGGSIDGLTMNDFLTLMTAQLKNQDPLNPTDSNAFLSQLSELSTVEGISQLNTSVSTLSNSMLASQALSSASLVGQTILTPGSAANYTTGGTLSGAVQVPTGATGVSVAITNSAGVVVQQMSVPAGSGLQNFGWNGTMSNGAAAPSGTYNVTAIAEVGGHSEAATTSLNATVTSVT
ncbi:MAG: flagellar hook assembly protein FlgD, partial [Steroidobacteraceae bacterium]